MNQLPKPKKGQVIHCTIETAAFEGKGMGRISGFPIFIKNTAPGDEVKARIIKKRSKYYEGELLDVLTPGPLRITPKCQHAVHCGGCSWQHLPYGEQARFKGQQVKDHIQRIGGLPQVPVLDVLAAKEDFYFRNKMEYSFGDRRWLTRDEIQSGVPFPEESIVGGMHAPGRFDRILHLNECHLQDPVSFQIMYSVRSLALSHNWEGYNPVKHEGFLRNIMIRTSAHTSDLMVNVVTNGKETEKMKRIVEHLLHRFPEITTIVQNVNATRSPTSIGTEEIVWSGSGFIEDSIGGFSFRIHANTFFQTNTLQAEVLYDVARTYANPKSTDIVYDLYCGVGTLSLYMANQSQKVVGIELNPVSIENAQRNAIDNGIDNVFFEVGDMKDTFNSDILHRHGPPDVIITDPPRAGMHGNVVKELLSLGVKTLVYVSCNSSTMARDLALLQDRYNIHEVQPVDMFPQTYHIEAVAKLTAK